MVSWVRHLARAALFAFVVHGASAWAVATVRDLQPTGPQPMAIDPSGNAQPLYAESHALLISASRYAKGWRRLDATHAELDDVAAMLQRHGFHVRRVQDPDAAELRKAFQDFKGQYGFGRRNRLLFFFSGHGYTNPDSDMGYLVPVDAADPNVDPAGFFTRAMAIEDVQTIAKEIVANHALFLFDSCFSGSIFATKAAVTQPDVRGGTTSERWEFLNGKASKKVRQFIAAGGPKEELPAKSVFVPLFIEALGGRGSRAGDGYITGKELGLWIEQTLPSYNRHQSPHSDVIKVPELSFGDVVFQVPNARTNAPSGAGTTAALRSATEPSASPAAAPDTRGTRRRLGVGDRFRDCDDDTLCPWLRVLPGGSFQMGSPKGEQGRYDNEEPQHRVTLPQGFALMEGEVTRGQFARFVQESGYRVDVACHVLKAGVWATDAARSWRDPGFPQSDSHPVVCLNWHDAQAYAKWLSRMTGHTYRLPTEVEWEYAARAGSSSRWSFGDDEAALCGYANVLDVTAGSELKQADRNWTVATCDDRSVFTSPSKSYNPNAWGLYDMHGNAWEWVEDCWHNNYQGAPQDGSEWRANCSSDGRRLLRGGGWNYIPRTARAAIRNAGAPDIRGDSSGFRLVRSVP